MIPSGKYRYRVQYERYNSILDAWIPYRSGDLTTVSSKFPGDQALSVAVDDHENVYLANGANGIISYSYATGALVQSDTTISGGYMLGVSSDDENDLVYGGSLTGVSTYSRTLGGSLTEIDQKHDGGSDAVWDISRKGKHLFASQAGDGIVIYEIAKAGTLTYKSAFDPGAIGVNYQTFIHNSGRVLATTNNGMAVLQDNLDGTVSALHYDTTPGTTCYGVCGCSKWVAVAAGTAGVYIYSIGVGGVPTVVGSYDTPGNANKVKTDGTYYYVSDSTDLLVLSVASDGTPSLVNSVGNNSQALTISSDYLFSARTTTGIRMYSYDEAVYANAWARIEGTGSDMFNEENRTKATRDYEVRTRHNPSITLETTGMRIKWEVQGATRYLYIHGVDNDAATFLEESIIQCTETVR